MWSMESLKKRGSSCLKRKENLLQCQDAKICGNKYDKFCVIDSWTYHSFVEAQENYEQVTTRNLQKWVLTSAGQYEDFKFEAFEFLLKKD